jgi:hypothetical protein
MPAPDPRALYDRLATIIEDGLAQLERQLEERGSLDLGAFLKATKAIRELMLLAMEIESRPARPSPGGRPNGARVPTLAASAASKGAS